MTEPREPDSPLDPAPDPALDPALEEAVRRTLAEAGGPETPPDEVVARLDGVLGDLVAERSSLASVSHPEGPGLVIPLDDAARRRRWRVRALLGAAAAVVVVGVGAGVIKDRTSDSDLTTAAESDKAPARDAAGTADEPPAAQPDADSGSDSGSALEEDGSQATAGQPSREAAPSLTPRRVVSDAPLREVRADHLREDLVALQHVSLPHAAVADYAVATLTAPADFMCPPADFGAGYLVGVTYDGKPAVVAFREPMGETQEAEVLACGTGDVIHSTVLAATG